MIKGKKKFVTTLVLILVFTSVSVFAYNLIGWKMPTKTMSYKWGDRLDDGSSVLKTGWKDGAYEWKNSSAQVNFFYHSSSINLLNTLTESSSTLYGRMYTWKNSNNIVTQFKGYLNAWNPNITGSNVAKSTAVHEFGHTIGLNHTSGTSIMNSNRNRSSIYRPQWDDIRGVNAIY